MVLSRENALMSFEGCGVLCKGTSPDAKGPSRVRYGSMGCLSRSIRGPETAKDKES